MAGLSFFTAGISPANPPESRGLSLFDPSQPHIRIS
jgi:hypothetical protein